MPLLGSNLSAQQLERDSSLVSSITTLIQNVQQAMKADTLPPLGVSTTDAQEPNIQSQSTTRIHVFTAGACPIGYSTMDVTDVLYYMKVSGIDIRKMPMPMAMETDVNGQVVVKVCVPNNGVAQSTSMMQKIGSQMAMLDLVSDLVDNPTAISKRLACATKSEDECQENGNGCKWERNACVPDGDYQRVEETNGEARAGAGSGAGAGMPVLFGIETKTDE
jgi:hypothetical protein